MRYFIVFLAFAVTLLFVFFKQPAPRAYINGNILTMDSANSVAQAMLINGERIFAVGSNSSVLSLHKKTGGDAVIDLKGATVMPGFVDAHSHFPSGGIADVVIDMRPPPAGEIDTADKLLARISDEVLRKNSDEWLLGYNYDNTVFPDGAHPTRAQLDAIAPDHAVYLYHNSGHMGVANSVALQRLSERDTAATLSKAEVKKNVEFSEKSGLLQEKAAPKLSFFVSQLPKTSLYKIFTSARDRYLAAGITTVQNGHADDRSIQALRWAQRLRVLPQRVVLWPAHKVPMAPLDSLTENQNSDYFRLGAVKIIVDGSPQGMTAFLSKPFFNTDNHSPGYRGFPLFGSDELNAVVLDYHRAGLQLALHGNGDAAIDQIIDAVTKAQAAYPRPAARHILVHAQTLRKDQTMRLASIRLFPSFFVTHTYYYGDWHRTQSLGPERAQDISPTGWAEEAGLTYSLHSDAPVTPMRPFELLWSAENRMTHTGFVLGEHQRITRQQALRAITINAAWQSHLDEQLGSIEAGKLADFIILSGDPLTSADPRTIEVLNTFINGVERYARINALTASKAR